MTTNGDSVNGPGPDHTCNNVEATGNIVEATFDFVEATFDFVATNGNNHVERFYCKISSFRQSRMLLRYCGRFGYVVSKNGKNVEATFDTVERIVQLVAFDNVAWTLLLVWTGLTDNFNQICWELFRSPPIPNDSVITALCCGVIIPGLHKRDRTLLCLFLSTRITTVSALKGKQ